jgi:predicted RNase H-like nuclease
VLCVWVRMWIVLEWKTGKNSDISKNVRSFFSFSFFKQYFHRSFA